MRDQQQGRSVRRTPTSRRRGTRSAAGRRAFKLQPREQRILLAGDAAEAAEPAEAIDAAEAIDSAAAVERLGLLDDADAHSAYVVRPDLSVRT